MKQNFKFKNYIKIKVMGGLTGNALTCAMVEPLWAIAYGMIFFYISLYMKAFGVSEVEMGYINSFGAILAAITSFLAGPITDRLGRKKTTLYFDILAWTLAMAIWTVSQNFAIFILAAAFNSFSKVPATSWTCLAIEDTTPDKRAIFFGLITIIGLGSGIFTPITGFLIDSYGIIVPMRFLFVIGGISMTLMFFIRNKNVKETEIGKQLMQMHTAISFRDKCFDYIQAMKFMVNNKLTFITLIIVLLTNFQGAFQFFLVLYLKNQIGLSAGMTSLIPGLSALINLIIYFVFIPKLIKKSESRNLVFGLSLSLIGTGLFLLVFKGGFLLLVISTIFTATGNLIMVTFRDTLWNNVIGEGERAKIFSACQGFISIIAIPSGVIAGYLYTAKAIYPFITSFFIFLITLILSVYAFKLQSSK